MIGTFREDFAFQEVSLRCEASLGVAHLCCLFLNIIPSERSARRAFIMQDLAVGPYKKSNEVLPRHAEYSPVTRAGQNIWQPYRNAVISHLMSICTSPVRKILSRYTTLACRYYIVIWDRVNYGHAHEYKIYRQTDRACRSVSLWELILRAISSLTDS